MELKIEDFANKEPFRIFEHLEKQHEFYSFEDFGIEGKIDGLPFRFIFDNVESNIKIVVDKKYYDSVPEFFDDEVLPFAFDLWLSANTIETYRKRFSKIIKILLPLCVIFFFYSDQPIVKISSWVCTVLLLIYWVFFIKNIRKYKKNRIKLENKLGEETSSQVQSKLKEYYSK